MSVNKTARIIGLGKFLPKKVLNNQELESMVETSHDWIVSRTGIHERRIAVEGEHASFLGFKAAEEALQNSGIAKESIQMIICATMTPDYITPSTAALIQKELGIPGVVAFDMQAACTGFLYAIMQAKAFIESGLYDNILVVATEKMSSVVDYKDRNTCVLFGDGAASAVISSKGKGLKIDTVTLGADGDQSQLIYIPGGGSRLPATATSYQEGLHFVKMEGREVFKHAVRRMSAAIKTCLEKAELKEEEISWLVPHQANQRIIDAIASNYHISAEKIYMTLHKYGNTSGSSVAIALTELVAEGKIEKGDHLLLVAFGAGLTWGAALLTQETSHD